MPTRLLSAVLGLALLGAAPARAAAPAAPTPPAAGSAAPASPAPAAAEAPAEEPAPASPELFERALTLHHQGKPRDAAPLFYAFIAGSPRTADNYEWAQFFLGEDLAQLGFTHAAVVYFADVAKARTRLELLPEALGALERITAKVPYDTELVEREVLYGTDFGFVPPRANDYVHFHKGLIALQDRQLRWANGHFEKLNPGSVYGARARLVRAVRLLQVDKDKDGDEALAEFEKLAADEKAAREVRNEARIGAARLHFERGNWDKAQALYDAMDLPELDPGRGQIYLEKAWAFYRTGDYGRAMGLLLALDAPSFRELFLPEKYVLGALIYKDRCHFLPAKRAARGFLRRYKAALNLIRERGNLVEDPRLLSAALQQDATVRRAGEFLDLLGHERDLIDRYTSRFEASGLTRALRQLYDRALAEALRQREALLRRALIAAANELLREEEQIRLLDYEIGLDLYRRVKKSAGAAVAAAAPEEVAGDEVAYVFDGEYWNDELKDFRLFLPSRCAAVEADR